jgi:thiamine pyrophosphokinase
MRAIIFANGVMNNWPATLTVSSEKDLLIAADGGLNHCLQRNITPHLVIGDMDSLDTNILPQLEKQGVEIIRYSAHKNQTDLELAIHAALDRNIHEIILLGALGRRWDMTLANVFMLASAALENRSITILEEHQEIYCLHGEARVEIHGRSGDRVSLLPLMQDADGVTLDGFEYPLSSETLIVGSARGVSNRLLKSPATVHLKKGHLLVMVSRRG